MPDKHPPEPVQHAGRAWLQRAWTVLHEEHVLPTPQYRRHLRVGHDFYGHLDQDLYDALEQAVQDNYPRYAADLPLYERQFASPFLFSLLSAVIADASPIRTGASDFSRRHMPDSIVNACLDELHATLTAPETDVACLRLATHLTISTKAPVDLNGITVTPILTDAASTSRAIARTFEDGISGAAETIERHDAFVYAPPESILSASSSSADPYTTAARLSGDVERLLLAVRLFKPATCQSAFEIRGERGRIRRHSPEYRTFRGAGPGFGSPTGLLRRTATLEPTDAPALAYIQELLRSSHASPGSDMAFTSLALALHKFTMSFHAHAWHEQLVDLATALEGALAGSDTSDVTLRLRTRAAALLNTPNDPAGAIFKDTKTLYGIRSKLVHGSDLSSKSLLKNVSNLSTARPDDPHWIALARAVDRLRDLVRRALLARLTLATSTPATWQFGKDDEVDVALADDTTRTAWRRTWQQALRDAGAHTAPDAATPAEDSITPDDIAQP